MKRSVLILVVFLGSFITTGVIGVHTAIERIVVENERSLTLIQQTPAGPRAEIAASPASPGYDFSLATVRDMLVADCGMLPEQFQFLTAIVGTDDKNNKFTINASPEMRFTPPYVVTSADDVKAWNADPEGLLVSKQIASPNGWKVGDAIVVHHRHVDARGRISAIVGGMSPKVYFHPAHLDTFLPAEERARARYIAFPVVIQGDYKHTQAVAEAGFERAGTPAWVVDAHDYVTMTFQGAWLQPAAAVLSLLLGLCIAVAVASAVGVLAAPGQTTRTASWVCAACVVASAAAGIALHLRYKDGGIQAGKWFLESVPVSAGDALHAVAWVCGVVAAATLFACVFLRGRRSWVAGVSLTAVCLASVCGLVLGYESLRQLRSTSPGGALANERIRRIQLRDRTDAIRTLTLRGTRSADVATHAARVEGRFPGPGEIGVVVGASLVPLYPSIGRGTLIVGRHRWPVLGVLHAPGTAVESEVWCDEAACTSELGPEPPPSPGEQALPGAAARLADLRRPWIFAMVALAISTCLAIWMTMVIARRAGVASTAVRATVLASLLTLAATAAALHGRVVCFGAPLLATRIHLTSAALIELGVVLVLAVAAILAGARAHSSTATR